MEKRDRTDAAAPERADPAKPPEGEPGPRELALRELESQFGLVSADPRRVRDACRELAGPLEPHELRRLLPLLQKRTGPAAEALFSRIEEEAAHAEHPRPLLLGLCATRDASLRRRGLELALRLAEEGREAIDGDLAEAVAARFEEKSAPDPSVIVRLAALLRRRAAADDSPAGCGGGGADPVASLLLAAQPPAVRRLAARILDHENATVRPASLADLLGPDGAASLGPLLDYTRATHRDLVDLTPDPDLVPGVVASLREAERTVGRTLLGEIIAELGWERVALGLFCRRLIGIAVAGGPVLVVTPAEAGLLEASGPTRRLWDRFLLVAHGGTAARLAENGEEHAAVQRFRRYNVLHAELLGEILEVAPLTPARVRRIFERMDEVVALFVAIFSGQAEDARRVDQVYGRLRRTIEEAIATLPPERPLDPEATRLVNMFEDPASLADVRTLHGLKRYLHQQGLRHAFRVFRSGRATNRTVDLVLAARGRVLQVMRKIRYIDFEPEAGAEPGGLPLAAALVAEAFGRRLLHGVAEAPGVEVLIYGNEVQAFVSFRNHPVFLRMDLSPPQRGGMIDLEYFGVSQYEMDRHPDLSLPWIQQILRRLEFDVQAQDFKLHVRYDKERAVDLGDLTRHARLICALLPHLMDLDWILGTLAYPEPAKRAVADAWADLLAEWGRLPLEELLTADRRRVLCGTARDPAGERPVEWDGRGEYQDRFSGAAAGEFWRSLRAAIEAGGLGGVIPPFEVTEVRPGQLSLEARVLEPLREALAGRRARTAAGGQLVILEADVQPPPHEAERLAELLTGPREEAEPAARLAVAVASIERQLRFVGAGSVHGYPVQRARLVLRGEQVDLAVLRDAKGIARLALAIERPCHLGPIGCPRSLQRNGRELDCVELTRRLRRDNYLTAGCDAPVDAAEARAELEAMRAAPNPMASPAAHSGDRVLPGIIASPGQGAGFARFAAPGRDPEEIAGAVLVAESIRPEDTPLLRRCSAMVSTGGGILSHAGLIALELRKPGLLISGRWERDAQGAARLLYRLLDYREETVRIGGLEVVCRRDLHEREEVLREGDLLVVDAELGLLSVLGQDRDTLALHQELAQFHALLEEARQAEPSPKLLALRGRLLRTIHQLRRLFDRLDRCDLARYAARALLFTRTGEGCASARGEAGDLLRVLLANAACGETARATVRELGTELARRREGLETATLRAVASAECALEVLHLRLGVRRLRDIERETAALARSAGLAWAVAEARAEAPAEPLAGSSGEPPSASGPGGEPCLALEAAACRRLAELRAAVDARIEDAAGESGAWWRLPHLVEERDRIDQVLGETGGGAGTETDARPCPELHAANQVETHAEPHGEILGETAGNTNSDVATGPVPPAGARILDRVEDRCSAACTRLHDRLILGPGDGGLELAPLIGRKGANLGEVARILGPERVPAWFAVSDAAFQCLLDAPPGRGAVELGGGLRDCPTLAAAIEAVLARRGARAGRMAAEIRCLWLGAPSPARLREEVRAAYRALVGFGPDAALPYVAVRSSALEEDTLDVSWAGQFDTFLFLRGEEALLEHIRLAMASLWTERAIQHRRLVAGDAAARTPEARLHTGVLVQRMVDARSAGVLHTLSPTTGQHREMILNAGLGLGEGVVSGLVEVDHVVVSRGPGLAEGRFRFRYAVGDKSAQVVFDRRSGAGTRRVETLYHQRLRPALEYSDLSELVRAAALLEHAYGHPLDVEFAFEEEKLNILQVRPIVAFQRGLRETMKWHPLKPSSGNAREEQGR